MLWVRSEIVLLNLNNMFWWKNKKKKMFTGIPVLLRAMIILSDVALDKREYQKNIFFFSMKKMF